VLACLGGALGFALAGPIVTFFTAANPGAAAARLRIGVDGAVMAFALGVTIVTSVILAWAPAALFTRMSLHSTLQSGRGESGAASRIRLRVLLVSEVALTVVLLVAAGLLLRSFVRVTQVDAGFSSDHVLTGTAHQRPRPGPEILRDVLDRTAALPGARASAVSDWCRPRSRDGRR
jgi:hypothetical protein